MANKKKQKKYQVTFGNEPAIDWKSKNFMQIIQFYLIETPAHNEKQDELVSKRGRPFKSYGWEGGHKFTKLLQEMINVSRNLSNFETIKEGPIHSKVMEIYPPIEYCLFVSNKYKTNHLLKAIRNSLAHGEIYQLKYNREKIYVLQNHHRGSLRAEIVLYEQTLLKWIDVIKTGPIKQEKKNKK